MFRRLGAISVLLCTKRPEFIDFAVAQVQSQKYPDIELLVSLHGEQFELPAIHARLAETHLKYSIQECPSWWNLGQCLNAGAARASGYFIAKMDDDDFYGPDHLSDLVRAYDYSGAPAVGKWGTAVYLEQQNITIYRHPASTEQVRYSIIGGTMMCTRPLILTYGFMPLRTAIDRTLFERLRADGIPVFSTHGFGFIYRRHSQEQTWAVSDDYFIKRGREPPRRSRRGISGPILSVPTEGRARVPSDSHRWHRAIAARLRKRISRLKRRLASAVKLPASSLRARLMSRGPRNTRQTAKFSQIEGLRVSRGRRLSYVSALCVGGEPAIASTCLDIADERLGSKTLIGEKPAVIFADMRVPGQQRNVKWANEMAEARARWPGALVFLIASKSTLPEAKAQCQDFSIRVLTEEVAVDSKSSIPPFVSVEVLRGAFQNPSCQAGSVDLYGFPRGNSTQQAALPGSSIVIPSRDALESATPEACGFAKVLSDSSHVRLHCESFDDDHQLCRALLVCAALSRSLEIVGEVPLAISHVFALPEMKADGAAMRSGTSDRWRILTAIQERLSPPSVLERLLDPLSYPPRSIPSIGVVSPNAFSALEARPFENIVPFYDLGAAPTSKWPDILRSVQDQTPTPLIIWSADAIDSATIRGMAASMELTEADIVAVGPTHSRPRAVLCSLDLLRTLWFSRATSSPLRDLLTRAQSAGAKVWHHELLR